MMFSPSEQEQDECIKRGFSKMYFFGGRFAEERRGQPVCSPLYELHIVWSKT